MNKYQEALGICKGLYDYRGNRYVMPFEMDSNTLDTIEQLVENHEKYRWHDLRKNPYDLPEKNGEYLVVLLPPNKDYLFRKYSLVIYSDLMGICIKKHWHNGLVGTSDYENYDGRVVAWKCVEGFEYD